MTLPILPRPVYSCELPSNGQKVEYYPFTIKELKSLMIAQQSEDIEISVNTIKNVILSCLKTKVNNELTVFDLEYLFIKLRSVSIGESIELIFKCDVCTSPKAKTKVNVDLNTAVLEKHERHSNKIPLFGDVGIVMKYPSLTGLELLNTINFDDLTSEDTDKFIDIIIESIDYIYDSEQMYPSNEQKKSDMVKFIEQLDEDALYKMKLFFDTMPEVRLYVDYVCPECGREHNKYVSGISTFF